MAEINSTFTHGINKDINPLKADNSSLFHLENGRILTDDNGTAFSIQNIKGNTEITITDESVDNYSNYEIVGHETFGKDICVFYVSNTIGVGGFHGRIALLKYVSDLSYKRFTLYNNEDFKLKANDNFRSFKCYESEFVKKVYFCSDTIRFMHLNIAIGDADPNLDISYEDIRLTKFNQLFIVGNVRFSPITFVTYGTGTLGQGSVQYSYRFYNSHGAETVFSQPSAYIALSKDINKSVSQAIRGKSVDDPEASSNKSVTMTVDLTNGGAFELYQEYDYIEIVRLYYSNIYSVPEVTIIHRLPTKASITFVDEGGVGLGSIIYSEFLQLKRDFTFRASAEKFNKMFLGNIKEEQFDVDFDARVYRYRLNRYGIYDCAVIFDTNNNFLAVDNYFRAVNIENQTEIYLNSIPIEHDCINPQNNLKLDYTRTNTTTDVTVYDYIYNTEGQLGASGPNVEIIFSTTAYYIDDNNDTSSYTHLSNRGININIDDNNRDWILGSKRGWTRNEIYRIGIVFFDSKGRQSFVKWCGDIRMPSITDYPIVDTVGNYTMGIALYPVVKLKTIPTGAVGYKVVAVKREESDKTIVCQGLVGACINAVKDDLWGYDGYGPQYKFRYHPGDIVSLTDYVPAEFISPEISFNKKNYLENGKVELLMAATDAKTNKSSGPNSSSPGSTEPTKDEELEKYITYTEAVYSGSALKDIVASGIATVQVTRESAQTNKLMLYDAVGSRYIYYYNWIRASHSNGNHFNNARVSVSHESTPHGTTGVFLSLPFAVAGVSPTNLYSGLLCNIVRHDVTQYNGNTYNDRFSNTYIAASDTYYSTEQNVPCYYGDTYICYFDYLRGIKYTFDGSSTQFQDILYFPVETSINLNLRYDLCYSRIKNSANRRALTELQGVYHASDTEGTRYDFKQETDLYLYSDIHSKAYDCQKYFPRPFNFEDIEHSPTSVIWSKKKIDGEDRDSWLIYGANDRNNLPKVFGELNKMVNFFGQVYCWQEDAVSMAQIEPQVIQGGVGGEQTIVGTGTTLGRFTTLQNDVGINHRNNLIQSVNAIYWLDVLRRKIYTLLQNGEIVSLSDTKMIEGYMRYAVSDNSIMLGVYDNTYAEVLLTLRDSEEIYNTITEITPPVTVITLLSVTVGSKITLDLLGSPMTFTASTATTSMSHFAVGATLAQTMTNFGTMFNSYLAANSMSTYYTISTEDNTITIKGTGVVAVPDFNTSVDLASVSSSIDATLPGGQKGAHIHLLDPDSSAVFNSSDVSTITNIHVQVPAYTMTSDCVVVVSIYEPGAPDKFEIWKQGTGESGYTQVATSCMDEYFDGTNPLTSSNYGVQTGGGKTYKFYNDWLLTLPYGQPHNGKNVQDYDGNGILDDNDRWIATTTTCAALFKQAHYEWGELIGNHAADCGESEFFLGKENSNGTQNMGVGNTNTYPIAPFYDDRSAAFQADTGIDPRNPSTYLMSVGSTTYKPTSINRYVLSITVGKTYRIENNDNGTLDVTNIGAPNNNEGTTFVATGTIPTSWGVTVGRNRSDLGSLVNVTDYITGDSYGQLMWYKAKAGDKIRIKVTSTASYDSNVNEGSGWKYSFRTIKTNEGDITFTTEQQTASSISYTTVTTSSILTAIAAGSTISVQDSKYFDIEPNGTYRISGEDMVITDKSSTTFTTGYLGPGYIDLTRYSLYNNNTTIVFSEKLQQFIGFYTFVPKYYIDCQGHYLTSADNIKLWKHNYGDKGKFYGLLNDMRLEFYVSINSNGLAEWNNLRWYSEVYDSDNKLLKNETINSIRVRNAYQQTDEIILYPRSNVYGDDNSRIYLWTEGIQIPTSLTATYGNVNKVIDHWITAYPRMPLIAETVGGITGDYSPIDYSGDYNLGVAGTYNSSATSDRLRSPFVKVTMFFTNVDDKLINLYDITSIVDVKLV